MASIELGNRYVLTNAYAGSSKALASTQDDTNLFMDTINRGNSQQWYITATELAGYYRFHTIDTGDNIALDVINDNGVNSINLHFTTTGLYTGQYWRLDVWPDGSVRLSNNFTGVDKHLDTYSNTLQPFLADGDHTGQHWTFENLNSGSNSPASTPESTPIPVTTPPSTSSTTTPVPTPASGTSSTTSTTTSTAATASSTSSQNSLCTSQDAPKLCGSSCIATDSVCCPDSSFCPVDYYCSPIAGVAPAKYGCCPMGQTCAGMASSQAQPPAASSTSATSTDARTNSADHAAALSAGAIAGIVIGVVVVVLGVVAAIFFLRRRRRQQSRPVGSQHVVSTPIEKAPVASMRPIYEVDAMGHSPSYQTAELPGYQQAVARDYPVQGHTYRQ